MPANDAAKGAAIVPVTYRPAAPGLPIETFPLARLVRRIGRTELERVQHLRFNLLVVCTGRAGRHDVDFESVRLGRGDVLHVEAGQVHRWRSPDRYDAKVVVYPDIAPA